MSSTWFVDSDDERDNIDVERQEIERFGRKLLSASFESSDNDEESVIDGSKVPSSNKTKSRARHSFLDLSTLSSTSSLQQEEDEPDENPFDIIGKSIGIETVKPLKKKKSLGVPKSRVLLDTTDIYDRDDESSNSRHSSGPNEGSKSGDDEKPSSKGKRQKQPRIRKPTKSTMLETERKMQEFSRTEHLALPTFVPKPLESWHALQKQSRQELLNEIRANNPSFTPQDPDLPELPIVDIESMAASTLTDLANLIEDKPPPPTPTTSNTSTINKLSRFLNPDILKKKPTITSSVGESHSMIDLSDVKSPHVRPMVKSSINLSLDCPKPPSASKQLLEMQKQLGIRMQEKRAAMLAENATNIPEIDMEDEEEEDEKSVDSASESNDTDSEILSMDKENDDPTIEVLDEETSNSISEDEKSDDEEVVEEEEEMMPSSSAIDPTRPSLKSILTRIDAESPPQPAQLPQSEPDGKIEWFNSMRPAQFDEGTELLCSGVFGGDDAIPLSQNHGHVHPIAFSPLPPTPPVAATPSEQDDEPDIQVRRAKVRQLDDDEDDDSRQLPSENVVDDSESQDDDEEESNDVETMSNEELIDYKKQLFEMEAEESGSELGDKDKVDEEVGDSDEDDEADEELKQFIDTTASVLDEHELNDMAKVHLKLKNKEDEQQLKLLKEQYLDFEGDDDGKRLKLFRAPADDDNEEEDDEDPDYNNDEAEDEEEEEDDAPADLTTRLSELERQRSIQDSQAEELHLDEDLDSIGQDSPMFQRGLALKQKKVQKNTTTTADIQSSLSESTIKSSTNSNSTKQNQARTVTLSSLALAQRFSSTLVPTKSNVIAAHISTSETTVTTKKQHNPRQHVFATSTTTAGTNENQNPAQPTTGEKRAKSAEKTSAPSGKRFKQAAQPTTTTTITASSASVFSALALSSTARR